MFLCSHDFFLPFCLIAGSTLPAHGIPKQFQGRWAETPKSCKLDQGMGLWFEITSTDICFEDGCNTLRKVIASDQYKFSGYSLLIKNLDKAIFNAKVFPLITRCYDLLACPDNKKEGYISQMWGTKEKAKSY